MCDQGEEEGCQNRQTDKKQPPTLHSSIAAHAIAVPVLSQINAAVENAVVVRRWHVDTV